MNLVGERGQSGRLFAEEVPVWHNRSGQVRPEWLSACEDERTLTANLMERIASASNLQRAYRQVRSNGGSAGVDGMKIGELSDWFASNLSTLQSSLVEGSYKPAAVRGVKIPKPNGGTRQLGIPTVTDRVVQQAISQVLTDHYEPIFSPYSYGFRPRRSAHDALGQAASYVSAGLSYVIDLDLEKFFDEVNHHRLLWLLSHRVGDRRVITLIARYLRTGILEDGLCSQRTKGTPQGSPLSPLLSNIVLDELDQELTRRGHRFVRYADDVKIFVGSALSAQSVSTTVTKFIRDRLRLKVNETKSRCCRGYELNFLGHSVLSGGHVGLSAASERRLKDKVRKLTNRNRGVSMDQVLTELRSALLGWLHYFRYARMGKRLLAIDGWIRRKLKCYRLKQCKRVIGIVRLLRNLGVEKTLCWRTALSGKGWWRLSNSPALSIGMGKKWFAEQGYYSLSEHYKSLHRRIP